MSEAALWETLLARDPRFRPEAYFFVKLALDYTQRAIKKQRGLPEDAEMHVTGQELLQGIAAFAKSKYGPLARMVLNDWGVHHCEDFGHIVFNMVDANLLKKREEDRLEDFTGGYDFATEFETNYDWMSEFSASN